eukprot:m.668881 g.668881  ORF g.668881 m.668881 type:complete len:100 (+) comp22758_c0_seq4:91-390(+)
MSFNAAYMHYYMPTTQYMLTVIACTRLTLLAVLCLSPKVREKYGSVLLRVLTRDCVPQVHQAQPAEDLVYIVAQLRQSGWEQRTWRLSARHRCLRCAWD